MLHYIHKNPLFRGQNTENRNKGYGQLQAVQQFGLARLDQLDYQLAEERILPCELVACVSGGVVLVKRFVNQSAVVVRVAEHLDALTDFLIII